jgi:hypothetical protein
VVITSAEEWTFGGMRVIPVSGDRWDLRGHPGPVDSDGVIFGFTVRVNGSFDATALIVPPAQSSFGSLLPAIEFVASAFPEIGDAALALKRDTLRPE